MTRGSRLGGLGVALAGALACIAFSSCSGGGRRARRATPVTSVPPRVVLAPLSGDARPEVLLRLGADAFVVVGNVRARVSADEAKIADDRTFGGVVAASRSPDGSWVFRGEYGALAWSDAFIGPLQRDADVPEGRSRLPLTFRDRHAGFWVFDGQNIRRLPVPGHTFHALAASMTAALAYSEDGQLSITRDGGRSWERVPHPRVSAPFLAHHSEVLVRVDRRLRRLLPTGELEEVVHPTARYSTPLSTEETARLVEALTGAGLLEVERVTRDGELVVSFASSRHALGGEPLRYVRDCAYEPGCPALTTGRRHFRISADGSTVTVRDWTVRIPTGWAAVQVALPRPKRALILVEERLSHTQPATSLPSPQREEHADVHTAVGDTRVIALDAGRLAPLCTLPDALSPTHVFAREDGGFFLRVRDDDGGIYAVNDDCDEPTPLPPGGSGICFVDTRRGVAWGNRGLGRLWHTADGGRTWAPLSAPIDGALERLPPIPPTDFHQDGEACAVGPLVVRWDHARRAAHRTLGPTLTAVRSPTPRAAPWTRSPPVLRCERTEHAGQLPRLPYLGPPLAAVSCTDDTCDVRVAASERAEEIRLTLPARCSRAPRGSPPPDVSVQVRTDAGVLLSCNPANVPCTCPARAYWVPAGSSPIPLDVPPLSRVLQLVHLSDGGFALHALVTVTSQEAVIHLDRHGRQVSARSVRQHRRWPRGIVVHNGHPTLGVASGFFRDLALLDPARDGPPRVHLAAHIPAPSRLCRPDDRGVLLGVRSELTRVILEADQEFDWWGDSRFALRALGEETCLNGLTLYSTIGTGHLRVDGDTLTGVLRDFDTSTTIQCELEMTMAASAGSGAPW